MMLSRLATVLALSMVGTSITIVDKIYIQTIARDPGVEHSISSEILGPRNHPFPIVYISTRHFRTRVPESLIVLPQPRYDIISAYTQTLIIGPDCPGRAPVGNVWYTVKVVKHDKKQTEHCVLRRALACDYLTGVAKLSAVNWTPEELRPITDFIAEAKCDSATATSDGRQGSND